MSFNEPAAGMPAWLAQLVAALIDGQQPGTADDWARRLQAELVRLDGEVPFTVVHDWHARTVAPLLEQACADGSVQRAVGRLHAAALAGRSVTEPEWAAALEPALREVYQRAYGYSDAYAVNYANAEVYGTANGFGEAGTREYATYYAELATGANLRAYADANAIANARACAAAFATADPAAYAESYPYAAVRAYAQALADPAGSAAEFGDSGTAAAQRDAHRWAAYHRLADGLLGSLGRAVVESTRDSGEDAASSQRRQVSTEPD